MPSPRSRPWAASRRSSRLPLLAGRERSRLLAVLALLPWVTACASGGAAGPAAPPPAPTVARAEIPYLVSPLEGWDEGLDPALAERLEQASAALRQGRLATAQTAAGEIAVAAPGLAPAQVLAAQVDLAAGRPREARERLEPVVADHPAYTAAQLALGRAAERGDDPVAAFAAFQAVASVQPLAAERVEELRPRVLEILGRRVASAAAAGDEEAARQALERLQAWAPDAPETARAAWQVATARGDREGELAALRRLTAAGGSDERALVRRRADLELAVGDARAGLEIYQQLASRFPDDPQIAEGLASAKFRWRIDQLPPQVGAAAAAGELTRGDFALLLYWLLPEVRYGHGGGARIASDILEDPRREEIARVLNLGFMDVDRTLHQFYPDRPMSRDRALLSLLRLLAATAPVRCVADLPPDPLRPQICSFAVGCSLLGAAQPCPAAVGLSGTEAVEMIRRTSTLLGET